MELRPLSRTGIRVSALCLGTMTFGNESDETASRSMIDRFLEVGGNFIDTADVYSRGVSEEIVGRVLQGRRDSVILATKGRMGMGGGPNDQGLSRRHLTAALDASLRRLGTDWIDLYQLHWPDFSVDPEETFSALDDFVRAGKVRSIGVSNYLGSQLVKAIEICRHHGWAPIVSHQPQYSLVSREIDLETLPLCADEGIAVLPWSPLGGGVLSGKYRPGQELPPDSRLADAPAQATRRLNERNLAIVAEVTRIADELGRTPAQVALNWVLHRPGITSPIVGARTLAQLDDNLGAEGWQLEDVHLEALGKVSRLTLAYPHDMYRMIGLRTYE
jgi:aryl-alcohol dehydrogenase-like predicted oxidoreductase